MREATARGRRGVALARTAQAIKEARVETILFAWGCKRLGGWLRSPQEAKKRMNARPAGRSRSKRRVERKGTTLFTNSTSTTEIKMRGWW